MIYNCAEDVRNVLSNRHDIDKVVFTSGGFDPLHLGHLRCLLKSAEIKGENGVLVVACNSDNWLVRKKGFVFMPSEERIAIIDSIKGVDYTFYWDDGTPTVSGAIDIIRPNIFTKGGDRDCSENVPEFKLCDDIGCEVIFGVGGKKIQSSSYLTKNITLGRRS